MNFSESWKTGDGNGKLHLHCVFDQNNSQVYLTQDLWYALVDFDR